MPCVLWTTFAGRVRQLVVHKVLRTALRGALVVHVFHPDTMHGCVPTQGQNDAFLSPAAKVGFAFIGDHTHTGGLSDVCGTAGRSGDLKWLIHSEVLDAGHGLSGRTDDVKQIDDDVHVI